MGIVLIMGAILFLMFLPVTIGFLIGVIMMLYQWFHEKKAVSLVLAVVSFAGMLFAGAVAGLGLYLTLGAADYGGLLGN